MGTRSFAAVEGLADEALGAAGPSSRYSATRALHLLILAAVASLAGCASSHSWLYEHRTFECDRMQAVCAKAQAYQKEYRRAAEAERLEMGATLKAHQEACAQAQAGCDGSLRQVYEYDGDKMPR